MAGSNKAVIPPPPRLTGDYASDSVAIAEWMSAFYRASVVEFGLLDPAFQSSALPFDPNNLPDPANSTIARAQQTANEAYQLAASLVP